jgi:hypothetical protein
MMIGDTVGLTGKIMRKTKSRATGSYFVGREVMEKNIENTIKFQSNNPIFVL